MQRNSWHTSPFIFSLKIISNSKTKKKHNNLCKGIQGTLVHLFLVQRLSQTARQKKKHNNLCKGTQF